MSKFAKIALVAALVGACTSATAGEIRTEIYAEGATGEGSKVLYWDIYTATWPQAKDKRWFCCTAAAAGADHEPTRIWLNWRSNWRWTASPL